MTVKHVFDCLVFSLQNNGGGSTYWYNVVAGCLRSGLDAEVLYSEGAERNELFRELFDEFSEDFVFSKVSRNRFFGVRVHAPGSNTIIFHSSYYRVCWSRNARNIVTIHDFIPEIILGGARGAANWLVKLLALRSASQVICVSESTRDDLFRFFPWTKKDRVHVIYNGVADNFKNLCLPRESFLLFVGARRDYKNFPHALSVAAASGRQLVVVGDRLTAAEQESIQRAGALVEVVTNASGDDLCQLYSRAAALLHPSSYEGFGLTAAEALACGCPVLAFKTSSLIEVVPDERCLLARFDVKSALEALDHVCSGSYQAGQVNFSWRQSVSKHLEVYKVASERSVLTG